MKRAPSLILLALLVLAASHYATAKRDKDPFYSRTYNYYKLEENGKWIGVMVKVSDCTGYMKYIFTYDENGSVDGYNHVWVQWDGETPMIDESCKFASSTNSIPTRGNKEIKRRIAESVLDQDIYVEISSNRNCSTNGSHWSYESASDVEAVISSLE